MGFAFGFHFLHLQICRLPGVAFEGKLLLWMGRVMAEWSVSHCRVAYSFSGLI